MKPTHYLTIIMSIVMLTTLMACEDQMVQQMNNITSEEAVDPLEGIPRIDFQDALTQTQIKGPYLWLTSYLDRFHTLADATDADAISNITEGAVRETDIATHGINPYTDIVNFNWIPGTLFGEPDDPEYVPHVGANNIGNLVSETEGLENYRHRYRVIYGLLSIVSDNEYAATLKVGSDDAIKIWLNGEPVHRNPIARPTTGFQETVDVIINKGDNLLLVKVIDSGGHWAMFIDLEQTGSTEKQNAPTP